MAKRDSVEGSELDLQSDHSSATSSKNKFKMDSLKNLNLSAEKKIYENARKDKAFVKLQERELMDRYSSISNVSGRFLKYIKCYNINRHNSFLHTFSVNIRNILKTSRR